MQFDLFSIIIISLVAVAGIHTAYMQIRTRMKGIETEAVITDVRESWERTGDTDSLCFTYTVMYTNSEGRPVTAELQTVSSADKDLYEGDRILIRYTEDRQDYPVMIRRL